MGTTTVFTSINATPSQNVAGSDATTPLSEATSQVALHPSPDELPTPPIVMTIGEFLDFAKAFEDTRASITYDEIVRELKNQKGIEIPTNICKRILCKAGLRIGSLNHWDIGYTPKQLTLADAAEKAAYDYINARWNDSIAQHQRTLLRRNIYLRFERLAEIRRYIVAQKDKERPTVTLPPELLELDITRYNNKADHCYLDLAHDNQRSNNAIKRLAAEHYRQLAAWAGSIIWWHKNDDRFLPFVKEFNNSDTSDRTLERVNRLLSELGYPELADRRAYLDEEAKPENTKEDDEAEEVPTIQLQHAV